MTQDTSISIFLHIIWFDPSIYFSPVKYPKYSRPITHVFHAYVGPMDWPVISDSSKNKKCEIYHDELIYILHSSMKYFPECWFALRAARWSPPLLCAGVSALYSWQFVTAKHTNMSASTEANAVWCFFE